MYSKDTHLLFISLFTTQSIAIAANTIDMFGYSLSILLGSES